MNKILQSSFKFLAEFLMGLTKGKLDLEKLTESENHWVTKTTFHVSGFKVSLYMQFPRMEIISGGSICFRAIQLLYSSFSIHSERRNVLATVVSSTTDWAGSFFSKFRMNWYECLEIHASLPQTSFGQTVWWSKTFRSLHPSETVNSRNERLTGSLPIIGVSKASTCLDITIFFWPD